MVPVLFFDPLCVAPYSAQTLREQGLGGSEATTVRVAEALDAFVSQHNRTRAEGRYLPPAALADVEDVIVLRDPRALARVSQLFPRARTHLWVHDRIEPGSARSRWFKAAAPDLERLQPDVICVSEYQRELVAATLRGIDGCQRLRVRRIYNPVDDRLVPDGSPVDPTKLVFFSSPNKGLLFTLDAFRALRRSIPDLRLCVANPGRSEEHTSELQSPMYLVCRLLLEKKKIE